MTPPPAYDVAIPLIGFNPSGGIRMVIRVANALAACGLKIVFSVPAHAATPPEALHAAVAVRVRSAGPGLADRWAFVREMPRARLYVATGYQTPVLIALAAPRHTRIFYLIQNDEPVSHITYGRQPAWLKPALRTLARAGYRVPAVRIAVSSFVARRVGERRIHRVIPPGIDRAFLEHPVRERAAEAGERFVVGVLSHDGVVKGMDVALDAFATLAGEPRIHLIAFDGAHPAPLPRFVEPFSRVTTRRPLDIIEFYDTCDVFVFPSRVEGFGLPPLEAMARGAAVVVTNCGGVSEYARGASNCIMVRIGDARGIAAAVRRLLEDPALRAALARAGRETAERFPADRFATECAGEIERLLHAP